MLKKGLSYIFLILFCFNLGIQSSYVVVHESNSKTTKLSKQHFDNAFLYQSKENTGNQLEKNETVKTDLIPDYLSRLLDLNAYVLITGFYDLNHYKVIQSNFFSSLYIASTYYAFW